MRCRRVRDLLPLYVGADLDPRSQAAVAEHLGRCFACAREMKSQREAVEAYRSLADLDPRASARRHFASPGSVPATSPLWASLSERLRDEPTPSERWSTPRARLARAWSSPRLRLALAAAFLGASLVALGSRVLESLGTEGSGDRGEFAPIVGERGPGEAGVHSVGDSLEDHGVLEFPAPRSVPAGPRPSSRTRFVGRTVPNGNF